MTVSWSWYNNQRQIVLYTFCDFWCFEEFDQADQEAGLAINAVNWTVDAIVDFKLASGLPANIVSNIISVLRRNAKVPNRGMFVVVHPGPVLKKMIQVAMQIAPKGTLALAADVDEAERLIAEQQAQRAASLEIS